MKIVSIEIHSFADCAIETEMTKHKALILCNNSSNDISESGMDFVVVAVS